LPIRSFEPVRSVADYRDLVISDLADREAELLNRVVSLEHERDIYRSLVANVLGYLYTVLHDGHDRRYRERYNPRRPAA
jgi:hypothetical protein